MFCRYLKEFRVEQCPSFLQHKCTQHRPFTCFHWHFNNQRRRRPVRKRDGSFNYSADNYCTKYNETSGICEDGDEWVLPCLRCSFHLQKTYQHSWNTPNHTFLDCIISDESHTSIQIMLAIVFDLQFWISMLLLVLTQVRLTNTMWPCYVMLETGSQYTTCRCT